VCTDGRSIDDQGCHELRKKRRAQTSSFQTI
jgi:hypothetical protein